jgi:cobyric acid synthase
MLGQRIGDPHGIETASGDIDGLGLLNVTTVLAAEKTLLRVHATHLASGCAIEGYEIHHGQTDVGGHEPAITRQDGSVVGVACQERNVWGTYLHGVFDADEFRRWFLDRLRRRRGLAPIGKVVACYDLEPALNRLAGVVRASLQMKKIYELMGL